VEGFAKGDGGTRIETAQGAAEELNLRVEFQSINEPRGSVQFVDSCD
jgi:hypothetical protein